MPKLHFCSLTSAILDGLCLSLGSKYGLDGTPYLGRLAKRDDLCKDLAGETTHQVTLKLLLLCVPEGARVLDDLLLFSVVGDGDGARRCQARRVEPVLHLRTLNPGQHDGLPQEEVAPRELLLRWWSERHGVCGAIR